MRYQVENVVSTVQLPRSMPDSSTLAASPVPNVAACTNGKCAASRKLSTSCAALTGVRTIVELVRSKPWVPHSGNAGSGASGSSGASQINPYCSTTAYGAGSVARLLMRSVLPSAGMSTQPPSAPNRQPW